MIYRAVYMFLFALNLIAVSLSPFKGEWNISILDDLVPNKSKSGR